MTSSGYETYLFLFVFLSTTDLSDEGCYDLVNINEELVHAKNLTDTISLVITQDSKDIMECTAERECHQKKDYMCDVLSCFDGRIYKNSAEIKITGKCERGTSQNISMYHFMCLTAKALNFTVEGCEYETVCNLYSERASVLDQTTASPPRPTSTTLTPPTTTTTTLPPMTTVTKSAVSGSYGTGLNCTAALSETATVSETTAVSETATLSETTVSETTTTTTTVTKSAVSGSYDPHSHTHKCKTDTLTLTTLLMMSVILNALLPLAVYLYMHHQRRQGWRQEMSNVTSFLSLSLHGDSPGTQPMTELKQASANWGGSETSHLMQPTEHLADMTSANIQ